VAAKPQEDDASTSAVTSAKWSKKQERAWEKDFAMKEKQKEQDEELQKQLIQNDRIALLEFFEAANGLAGQTARNTMADNLQREDPELEWKEDWNWNSDVDLQSWYGIETELLTGRVISVSLTDNKLTGTMGSSLFRLTELESLDLSDNGEHSKSGITFNVGQPGLTGTFPTAQELNKLPKLKTLLLSGNSFTGSLPNGLGTEACAPALEKVDVHENPGLGGEISMELARKKHFVLNIGSCNEYGNYPGPTMTLPWLAGISFVSENLTKIMWWNDEMAEKKLKPRVTKETQRDMVKQAVKEGHKWSKNPPPIEYDEAGNQLPLKPQEGCDPWQEAWAKEIELCKKEDIYVVCHTDEFKAKFEEYQIFADEKNCETAGFDPCYKLDGGVRAHNILDWQRRMILQHTGGVTPSKRSNEFGEVTMKYLAVRRAMSVHFIGNEGWGKIMPHWWQGKDD